MSHASSFSEMVDVDIDKHKASHSDLNITKWIIVQTEDSLVYKDKHD